MDQIQTPNSLVSVAFLSPAQLTARWQVTGMTLRRWRKAGKLKALHIGRQIRFSVSEIARFENEAAA
jgi:hypothetical protein